MSVSDAFEQLTKATEFNFSYEESVIKGLKNVSIQVEEGSIDVILKELSRHKPFKNGTIRPVKLGLNKKCETSAGAYHIGKISL
ncbi:MAG: hypothetical protein LBV72_18620 [Tannerella sp.]|jgi:hypothetical protein|nr:hypothetical protein [Tannerella sp.]